MSQDPGFEEHLKSARAAFRAGRREIMKGAAADKVCSFTQADFDWILTCFSLLGAELRSLKSADPALAYKGVWQPGLYKRGSFVTHGGSIFHADVATTSKPGDGAEWTLACKRGRDGKDAR